MVCLVLLLLVLPLASPWSLSRPTSSNLRSTSPLLSPLSSPLSSPLFSTHPSYSRPIQPAQSVVNIHHTPADLSIGGGALPRHSDVKYGTLPNGFSYCIMRNDQPSGRFESHLQVFTGSADELQDQQGLAHLTEHVAYMGSRKRERLFGTGSQTNAYTDFQHTVFYAACPTIVPMSSGGPGGQMMPLALDALVEVMEAEVDAARLEKERAAVLSEMTMVNTIEYRVECNILSTLHRESRLAKRFPIGKEKFIREWQRDDVLRFHRSHYRPDNVLLYVVGDLDIAATEKVIAMKFSHLSADRHAAELTDVAKSEAGALARSLVETVKSGQSWHYPPARHAWSERREGGTVNPHSGDSPAGDYDVHLQQVYEMDDLNLNNLPEVVASSGALVRPHIYRHELLQSFSLHVFAKRQIKPIITLDDFKGSLARRIVLAALQIRLNVNARGEDPPFNFVEFNQLDSAREGCAVCSFDLMADKSRWKEACHVAVAKIRQLGKFGLTKDEMLRYGGALLTDAAQVAAQNDRISHSDQLSYLMESVACGHTFMDPLSAYENTDKALSELSLADVNVAAAELCEHISSLSSDEPSMSGPVIAIACVPKDAETDDINPDSLVETLVAAASQPIVPDTEFVVPRTLVTEEALALATSQHNPTYLPGQFTDGTPNTPADKVTTPATFRRLSNGIRVGITSSDAESQRGHLRLVAPGGRIAEKLLGFKQGSMAIGARAMQEGGAFGGFMREQIELFCVDHLIMVEINCGEENLTMDFVFPTTPVGNMGFGDQLVEGILGTDAVLQVLREILQSFRWEEDALGRAKQHFVTAHSGLCKNLEKISCETFIQAMNGDDQRFCAVTPSDVANVNLDEAMTAVMSQLTPGNLEISMCGEFDTKATLESIRQLIGTIPADTNTQWGPTQSGPNGASPRLVAPLPGRRMDFELPDSDPRAVSYVGGAAPNRWGINADGSDISEQVIRLDGKASKVDVQRRRHPLFAHCALSLLSEIINRRLFSNVREKRQLTYDANFQFTTDYESTNGGYYYTTVTASKENAEAARDACIESLDALSGAQRITHDNVDSARRVVINRHEGEMRTCRYVATILSGLQGEAIKKKGPLSLTDFNAMCVAITVRDMQCLCDALAFGGGESSAYFSLVAKTVQPEGQEAAGEDEGGERLVRAPVGGSRGGPLLG